LVFGAAGAVGSRAATDTERVNAANAYDYNQVQQLVQLDSELQAALKLPEGPIRERAVQTAQNKMADKISGLMTQQVAQNAELTANYDADLNNRMSLAQRAQAAEWEQQHRTSIDTNPATHTPEQMAKINEYVGSVDEGLLDFAEQYFSNPNEKFRRYTISKVSDRQAQALRNIFGQDFSSFSNAINKNGVNHINKDHGADGMSDHSMQNLGDVARIGYVIDNFDTVDQLFNTDGSPALSAEFRDTNNNPAPLVKFAKKIDGTFYVVEAVPDNRYKKVWVVSAYISKNNNGDVTQAPHATALGTTSETTLASPSPLSGETMSFKTGTKMGYPSDTVSPDGSDIPSVGNSIRQNVGNSNTSDTNIPLSEAMQYGKTPEQAVMEARAKAEGEKFSEGVNANGSINGDADTAYSIGQMDKRNHPSSAGSSSAPFGRGAQNTRMVYENSITPDGAKSNTFGFTPEQIAKGTVPLSEAMQYGKTPEQAVMEANARAEGERVRQAREEQAAAEQQERLDRITNGKNRDIMQRVYEAQERAERVASRHALERATTRATASDADSYIDHTQEDIAIDLVNSLESERRFLTNLRNGWHLSDAELVNAERMAAGRGPVTEMDSHRYELVETYARAMRQYNEDMQPYYAFQRGLDDARLRRATELIKDSDNWKDSRGNLGLQIRTPERVLRKVMGDTAETEAIYQAYFAPVLKHDAEAIRWENTQRERLKGIMEGLSHEDSVYIHMKNRAELSPKNEAMQKQLRIM
ncbi:MAG: hypothetical protein ACLSF2_09740, partial [Butyricicoccus sp.]